MNITRKEINSIVREIILEGEFDSSANSGVVMNLKDCNINLDPNFTGLFFSNDPNAPNIIGRVFGHLINFFEKDSLLGWRNVFEFLFKFLDGLVGFVVNTIRTLIKAIRRLFSLNFSSLNPGIGSLCEVLNKFSTLFGNVFVSFTNLVLNDPVKNEQDIKANKGIEDDLGFFKKIKSFIFF